jgi:hypothetical protein
MDTSIFFKSVSIPAGATGLSAAFSLAPDGDFALVGIIMPGTWTAANLTFQMSPDRPVVLPDDDAPAAFYNGYDDAGNEVTVTAAASRALMLSQNVLIVGRCFKIRSGTSGTPVDQTATRTLTVIFRKV